MNDEQDATTAAPSLRNLQILEVLANEARPMTPTEINGFLGLPKPSIHRLVANLEALGYLSRHLDGRSYLPGPKVRRMMLGAMRAMSHDLPRREVLVTLNAAIGETCNLSIPDGNAMVYVDRVETQWPLRIALQVGSRVPLHATSAGKVALSFLPEPLFSRYLQSATLTPHTERTLITAEDLRREIDQVRRQGYSQDNEEFVDGMIAMAVPVLVVPTAGPNAGPTAVAGQTNGAPPEPQLVATVSFHAPRQRLSPEDSLRHLPALRAAAEQLAALT